MGGNKPSLPYTSYRRVADELKGMGRLVAAPSFCLPDTAAANCRYLADAFAEVALLFFETKGCLAYTGEDLPKELAELPLSYHVHLPLDLPWDDGVPVVWDVTHRLMEKVEFLNPRAWVLHPPQTGAELASFMRFWKSAGLDPADVLLENIEDNDLTSVLDVAMAEGCSLCLDLGHVLAYNQRLPMTDALWERVRMLHVYAPEGSRHKSLSLLDDEGRELLREFLTKAPQASVTLEVFEEQGLFESALLLAEWMREWRLA